MELICVIVPAFQENMEVLRQTLQSLREASDQYCLVLVDDGSQQSLKDALAGLNGHFVRHAINLGQGAALETGMAYARTLGADYVIHFDADGQHDPADIPALLAPLRTGAADIVLGSRFLNADHIEAIPKGRRRVLKIARNVERVLTGVNLTDAHCGLRALGPKAIQDIRLTEARMAHATELIHQIKQHDLRFQEVPVHVRYPDYAREKGQGPLGGLKILWDLFIRAWL